MNASWGTRTDNSEEYDDIVLMGTEDTEPYLIPTLRKKRLKSEYNDPVKHNTELKEKNKDFIERMRQLDSCNLSLKTKILKLSVIGKEKDKEIDQTLRVQDVERLKDELFLETENSRRINLELARIKYYLEQANKWTKFSMIVTHLGTSTRNIKDRICFDSQSMNGNPAFYTLCGNMGHSRNTLSVLPTILKLTHIKGTGEVNAPLQRLWASLAAKVAEITTLRVSHLVAINQLHISYGLEHSGLEEENARLKADNALDQVLAVPVAACNKLLGWVFWCFPSSPSSSGIFESSDGLSSACLLSCC
ncbi:hypothetical protein H5410_036399 [Solanum commersonii]|uniref:Uncharacterized protein n=1 Tax=Solanum commersonii TaxID=4109 RepID=A0A9J5Y5I8_SOLCO|nr:hypothetical protein H5410_036399 [Solanum commersonii]